MRRIKNARGWFWSVFPWPEQFYEREEDLEPIASDLMVSITSIIIFILCAAAFGYTFVFFSDPSQDTVDRIVSAQTAIEGYTCKPMGPDKWYGLNWTHAECTEKLRPITAETIDWPEPGYCDIVYHGAPLPILSTATVQLAGISSSDPSATTSAGTASHPSLQRHARSQVPLTIPLRRRWAFPALNPHTTQVTTIMAVPAWHLPWDVDPKMTK